MSAFGPLGGSGGMPATSAAIANRVTDKTGTAGSLVFSISPVLVTPNIGAATATSVNSAKITPALTLVQQQLYGGL